MYKSSCITVFKCEKIRIYIYLYFFPNNGLKIFSNLQAENHVHTSIKYGSLKKKKAEFQLKKNSFVHLKENKKLLMKNARILVILAPK